MIDIVAQRGDGDRPGNDIVEPLLSDLPAALARGKQELDDGELADQINLTIKLIDVRLGEMDAVADSEIGVWHGKVTAVRHEFSIDESGNSTVETRLTIRRPRESG